MDRLNAEARSRMLDRRARLTRRSQADEDASRAAQQSTERGDPPVPTEVEDRLGAHEQHELREIDAALERMARGTYGRCEGCGRAVGRQRLMAVPETRLCLGCASSHATARRDA